MSKKEGYSRKGLFGEIKHYDANGRKVGESRPNILGGYSLIMKAWICVRKVVCICT